MLNVLYVPEALRNNIICQDFYLDEPERIIEQLPNFFFFFILEALRHIYIQEYLRLSLTCATWDTCKCRHLTDSEADISSSRLSHRSYKRCPHCFVFMTV